MLIGLTGTMGSGKDTVYARLVENYHKHFRRIDRISFADKLKQSAAASLGVEMKKLEELKNDPFARVNLVVDGGTLTTITVREYLQKFGTEGGRDIFGPDFWVNQALAEFAASKDRYRADHLTVITDARFPNELRRIRELGGKIWRVSGPDDKPRNHSSEQAISNDLVDHEITNHERNDRFKSLDNEIAGVMPGFNWRPDAQWRNEDSRPRVDNALEDPKPLVLETPRPRVIPIEGPPASRVRTIPITSAYPAD